MGRLLWGYTVVLKMRCGWVVRTMDTLPAVRVRPVRTPTIALPSLAAEALLAHPDCELCLCLCPVSGPAPVPRKDWSTASLRRARLFAPGYACPFLPCGLY